MCVPQLKLKYIPEDVLVQKHDVVLRYKSHQLKTPSLCCSAFTVYLIADRHSHGAISCHVMLR